LRTVLTANGVGNVALWDVTNLDKKTQIFPPG